MTVFLSANSSMMKIVAVLCVLALALGEEVCHPPYGCFNDAQPFNRAIVKLPRSPAAIGTKFIHHTRDTWATKFQVPRYLDPMFPESVTKINYDGTKKTAILVHGYIESREVWYAKQFFEQMLKKEDMNVIFVDWSKGAAFPYLQATGDARLVGAQLARLVELLHNTTGLAYSDIHLLGFSLGSHVCGYAGLIMRRKGNLIGRITALDPAAPYFEYMDPEVRLDETDAEFVDVIHSDTKTILIKGFGAEQAMGHVDFYPNGGFDQPGCKKIDTEVGVTRYLACSHYRAVTYFLESINSACPFRAYPCNNFNDFLSGVCRECPRIMHAEACPRMGYNAVASKNKVKVGRYFLQTNNSSPYCEYHYSITFFTGKKTFGDLGSGGVSVQVTGQARNYTFEIPRADYPAGSTVTKIVLSPFDLGRIMKIKVEHNRLLERWYLLAVAVKPLWEETSYTGCFVRWLNDPENEVPVHQGDPGLCA